MTTSKIAARRKQAGDAPRLDADAWAEAALAELGARGISGVRVEALAKSLGVTKGSFYWHFKDRDALLERMLERWRRRATLALIDRLDSEVAAPAERLRALLQLPLHGRRAALAANVELAVRLWGRDDRRARQALEDVDELRLRYIARLLAECGVPPDAAPARAVLFYSYQRVAASLPTAVAVETLARCEAMLLAP